MRCALECDVSAELIVGYSAGTLDAWRATAFEQHMQYCSECLDAVAVQKAVWTALDEWPESAPSPDFDRRVFQRIAQAERRGRWLRRVLIPAALVRL